MKLKESINVLRDMGSDLEYVAPNRRGNETQITNLRRIINALNKLKKISVFSSDISNIETSTKLFTTTLDTIYFGNNEADIIKDNLLSIQNKIDTLLNFWRDLDTPNETGLDILLPSVQNFSELEEVAKDLKIAIEVTLNQVKIEHDLKIVTAEPGSIWLIITLGTTAALTFIGKLCKLAAQVRQEFAKAKQFEEYARTIKMNNEAMEHFLEQSKITSNTLLEKYATELAQNQEIETEAQTINHLKLSIRTFSDLMDKGAKFLPQSNSKEVKESFPNTKELDNIIEAIKKISNAP